MPKRTNSVYVCQQCGYVSPSFLGKCPECGTWNSLVEQINEKNNPKVSNKGNHFLSKPVNIKDIEKKDFDRLKTGLEEFDRVLGGGIVNGSVVLVAGDPGVGKSTLLSQLAINLNDIKSNADSSVLYVAGEESARQIKLRIDRIRSDVSLEILNEVDVDAIVETVRELKPSLVIVDSVQTLETQDLTAAAGSVSQVREASHRLQRIAKDLHIPIFLVGHVTKEGTVAGPKTLEHLVDVVLSLEGDSNTNFRVLRAQKNRFGPTDEVGIFEMLDVGMKEIKNPSELFLEQKVNAPGSAVTAILTGLRPMLLEIQALTTKTNSPIPRRVGTGIDNNRLQLLVAVLQKRLRLPLWDQDVFVNVTGGIKVSEPGADLAICMAIVSSFKDKTLPKDGIFIGEVGLLGELRNIRSLDKRINEAKKLGYANVISSKQARNLTDALRLSQMN